ncbi:hypothetical protein ACFW1M_42850, partial [Streptomyces inhibens]|uniref:hypothetical protein n=1 Tax=Streptomyces inhibens TaxID=2293571 RepID=UPI003694A11E
MEDRFRDREPSGRCIPEVFATVVTRTPERRSRDHGEPELVAAGPDAGRLRELSRALERIGDHPQAARAQFNLHSLQVTAW